MHAGLCASSGRAGGRILARISAAHGENLMATCYPEYFNNIFRFLSETHIFG